jgi:thiamine biosynthesis lipoprotein
MKQSFRAMGTEVTLITNDVSRRVFDRVLHAMSSIFEREEQRFSRFREDSELAHVNRSAGAWVRATRPFIEVVGLALAGAEATDGMFDPTLLSALMAAGYDRDFATIEGPDATSTPHPVPCGRWREVEVRHDLIRLPSGAGLDLGGLVKGWTADIAAEAVIATGLDWAVVNAGGDLRIVGEGPPLPIGIEEPGCFHESACVVRVDDGALATTSMMHRRWGPNLHHIIDPRLGLPARTPIVQATVWSATCAAAEISSKRAFLQGVSALDDLPGVLILASGEIVTNLAPVAA